MDIALSSVPMIERRLVRARQSLSSFNAMSVLWESGGEFEEVAFVEAGGDIFFNRAAAGKGYIFLGGENSSKPFLIRISAPE